MAGANIIKEYLVSLGFKLDQNSLNKFDSALVKTTKAALSFATTMAAVGTATVVFVDKMAKEMEDLYWSSVRVKDSVGNIADFKLSLSKVGGTAQGAANAIENIARYLRTNPAGEGFMRQLGIQTRDVNDNMVGGIEIARQLAHLPIPYWLKVNFAEKFGVDENTLQALVREAPNAENKLTAMYKAAGISADDAAKKSAEFENRLRDTTGAWTVAAVVLEQRLIPVANKLLDWADDLAELLIKLDGATGGLSTEMIALAAAIGAVNFALKLTFGTSILRMLAAIAFRIALITATILPAFSGAVLSVAAALEAGLMPAIVAVGAAIAATPIGWLIGIVALLAGAAYLVIRNWDTVKKYFGNFVDWLRVKYNIMAKYLGLPQWDKSATSHANDNKPGINGASGADGVPGENGVSGLDGTPGSMPDYQKQERNLGPNSMYGSDQMTGKALDFFKKAGWGANQAAGIVANLIHENSRFDPRKTGDSGLAKGIAQWHPDRQADYEKWSGKKFDDSTVDDQLAFVNHELTKGTHQLAGKLLAGATSAAQAGMIISKYYEAPKDQTGEMIKRGHSADQISKAQLAPSSGKSGNVTITQKTDIKVSSSDPDAAGRAVNRGQDRVNGDLVRNLAGAVT